MCVSLHVCHASIRTPQARRMGTRSRYACTTVPHTHATCIYNYYIDRNMCRYMCIQGHVPLHARDTRPHVNKCTREGVSMHARNTCAHTHTQALVEECA